MSAHSASLRDGSDSFFDEPEDELIVQSGFSSHHEDDARYIEEEDAGSAYHNEEGEEYYSDEYNENEENGSGRYEDDVEYEDEYVDEAGDREYSDEEEYPPEEEYYDEEEGSYSGEEDDASQHTSQPNSSEGSYRDDPYDEELQGEHSPQHSPTPERIVYHSPGFPQSQDDGSYEAPRRSLRGEHYVSSDDGGASYEDIVLYGDGSGSYDDEDHPNHGEGYHNYGEDDNRQPHVEGEEANGSDVDYYEIGGDELYDDDDDDASNSATYNNNEEEDEEYGHDDNYAVGNGEYVEEDDVSQSSYDSQLEEGEYASGEEPINEDFPAHDGDDASQYSNDNKGEFLQGNNDGSQQSYDSQFEEENVEYQDEYNDGSQGSYDSQFEEDYREQDHVEYPNDADSGSQESYDSQFDEEQGQYQNDGSQRSHDSQYAEGDIDESNAYNDGSQRSYDSQFEEGGGSYASEGENQPLEEDIGLNAEQRSFSPNDKYSGHTDEPNANVDYEPGDAPPDHGKVQDARSHDKPIGFSHFEIEDTAIDSLDKESEPQHEPESSSNESVDASIDEELPQGVDDELDVGSYQSLRSDLPKESARSSSQSSVTKAGALPNLGVESDFPGYSEKQTVLPSKQSGEVGLKESKSLHNSMPTMAAPKPNTLQMTSNSLSNLRNTGEKEFAIKGDASFVVNNSNRGAGMEPRLFFSTHRNISKDFSVDELSLGTQMYSSQGEDGQASENTNANPEKAPSYYQPDLSRDISLLLKASNHSQAQMELNGSNGSQTKFDLNSSNHASAKFAPTEDSLGKRYSFVGSDFGSSFSETDDDGINLDLSCSTKESREMKSMKEEELVKILEEEDKEYSVVRALAKEITTNELVRSPSFSPKRRSLIVAGNNSSLPTVSSAHSKTNNEPGYTLREYDTPLSPQQKKNLIGVGLSRKDSVDSYPTSVGNDEKSSKSEATPNNEQDYGEDSRSASQSDINGSDFSSVESPELRDRGKYWTAVPDEAYQEARTRASAPSLGVFQHIPHSPPRNSMTAMSTPATRASSPMTTNKWKDTPRKIAQAQPPTTHPPDNDDVRDLEAGMCNDEEQPPRKSAVRRRRPKWMYGIAGALLLFIFMLMIVLLRKKKDKSQDLVLSPTRSPSIPTTPVASTDVAPSMPPSTGTNNSLLIPFILRATLSGDGAFGTSVAMSDGMIAIAAPETATVQTFFQTNGDASKWADSSNVTGTDRVSQFGQSMDLVNERLLVGAPLLYAADGTTNSVGGVYAFVYDTVLSSWQQMGGTLQGSSDVPGEEFGASVSTSNAFRVVIGAPKSSRSNADAGRVYTYEYQASFLSWVSSEVFPLVGEKAGDRFGASVAVSQDGSLFIAGAPGASGPGYARLYYWLDTKWQLLAVLRGQDSNEAFGSSVSVLSANGDFVAVGGPGFANGAGRVAVYQLDPTSGRYNQLGPDIVGVTPQDGIGYAESAISGGIGPTGPVVVLATQQGQVQRYDYSRNANQWEQRYDDISFHASDHASIAYTIGEPFDTLVLGLVGETTNQTLIYQMETQSAVSTPNTTITDAPVGSITFAPIPPPTSNIFSSPAPVATQAPTLPSVVIPATDTPSLSPLTTTMPPVTAAPVATTMPPTTSAATPTVNTETLWSVSGGPFSGSSGNGSVVALSETRMVLASAGVVQTFTKQTISGVLTVWDESRVPDVAQGAAADFGQAIAVSQSSSSGTELMVVGAPTALVMSTQLSSGAVYCYYLDSTTSSWAQQGSTLPLSSDGALAGDTFGAAVAVSDGKRVAVGAPLHSLEGLMHRGSVYVYEYDSSLTDWKLVDQILGMTAEEQFGSAVDISASFLIVGAPGSGTNRTGAATIYQSSNFNWFAVTTVIGEQAEEAMGSAVYMLSPDGDVVAIGGPGYNQQSGRVVVYERNALTGRFEMLGTPIVGQPMDGIGMRNTFSGYCNSDKTIITVLISAQTGLIYQYQWNKSFSTWTSAVIVQQSSDIQSIASVSSSSSPNLLAVSSGSGDATIYEQ